jgi:uncharacterized surface protein with fasciclin (FAS1) repeats
MAVSLHFVYKRLYGGICALLILTIMNLGLVSCYPDLDTPDPYEKGHQTIADFLEENKEGFSKFYRIADQGRLKIPLSIHNPDGDGYTLFLPTDDAFERFIKNNNSYVDFDELMQDSSFVSDLGRYHLVNKGIHSYYFPFGALPANTCTGDLLTITYSTNPDSTVTLVNDVAPIIGPNIKMINGYIHIISEVLHPVKIKAFDWLQQNSGYSILAEAMKITELDKKLRNRYTILAEHDSIYHRYGINSIDDLIETFATPGLPYSDWDNSLFQFTAYHVLWNRLFLMDFTWGSNEYSTYAHEPVRIVVGEDIKINPGGETLKIDISEFGDTTFITHIRFLWEECNILTKSGPIHPISDLMYFYKP